MFIPTPPFEFQSFPCRPIFCVILVVYEAGSCSVGATSLRNAPGTKERELAIKRCTAILDKLRGGKGSFARTGGNGDRVSR